MPHHPQGPCDRQPWGSCERPHLPSPSMGPQVSFPSPSQGVQVSSSQDPQQSLSLLPEHFLSNFLRPRYPALAGTSLLQPFLAPQAPFSRGFAPHFGKHQTKCNRGDVCPSKPLGRSQCPLSWRLKDEKGRRRCLGMDLRTSRVLGAMPRGLTRSVSQHTEEEVGRGRS